jgi:hypothetical protein
MSTLEEFICPGCEECEEFSAETRDGRMFLRCLECDHPTEIRLAA